MTMEADNTVMRIKPKNVGSLQKLEKARKQIFPQNLQKQTNPGDTLILALFK